jgi:hypothetical protein
VLVALEDALVLCFAWLFPQTVIPKVSGNIMREKSKLSLLSFPNRRCGKLADRLRLWLLDLIVLNLNAFFQNLKRTQRIPLANDAQCMN